MCACTDAPCAEAVTAEITAWTKETADKIDGNDEPSAVDIQRVEEVGKAFGECATLAVPGSPQTPASDASTSQMPEAPAARRERKHPVGAKPQPIVCAKQEPAARCAMKKLTYFADAMCSCADPARAMERYATPSDAESKQLEAIGKRMGECTLDAAMTPR